MVKLLSRGMWYETVSPGMLYESQFQQMIISEGQYLFPGFFVVPFNHLLESEDNAARPDFALVDKLYRAWWVVEVELSSHPLEGHVIPQVETFVRANYGSPEAKALASGAPHLNQARLLDMVKGTPPGVLVVVDSVKDEWVKIVEGTGAKVLVVEVLQNSRNDRIYHVRGDFSAAPEEIVSECMLDPLIPRFLRVNSPAGLGVANGEAIGVQYRGGTSSWVRLDSADRVWLNPSGANPLEPGVRYVLLRARNGSLILRRRDGQQ